MNESVNYSSPADREADLVIDRAIEATPLPFSHVRHYQNEVQRQVDLAAAERANIAKAAGELGMTSREWQDLRHQLGRQPTIYDIKK